MEINDALRFDQYSVGKTECGVRTVTQLTMGANLMLALMMAGVTEEDFEVSMTHTGWVGSSPCWLKGLPVVTVPHKELLGMDQLDFMVEALEARID